jgi:succinate dehydrogenase flavin-adding protein (antitoxin of CptAB toxin-antitoxin module)
MPTPKRKPTATYSRENPLRDNGLAFPENDARGIREADAIFARIFETVLNGRNNTFSLADILSIGKSTPLTPQWITEKFLEHTAKLVKDRKLKEVPALFAEDGKLYSRI